MTTQQEKTKQYIGIHQYSVEPPEILALSNNKEKVMTKIVDDIKDYIDKFPKVHQELLDECHKYNGITKYLYHILNEKGMYTEGDCQCWFLCEYDDEKKELNNSEKKELNESEKKESNDSPNEKNEEDTKKANIIKKLNQILYNGQVGTSFNKYDSLENIYKTVLNFNHCPDGIRLLLDECDMPENFWETVVKKEKDYTSFNCDAIVSHPNIKFIPIDFFRNFDSNIAHHSLIMEKAIKLKKVTVKLIDDNDLDTLMNFSKNTASFFLKEMKEHYPEGILME